MIMNQNILATLLTSSNLQKNFYEKLYTKQTLPLPKLPKLPLLNLLAKFLLERKYLMNNFTLVRLKFST